MINRIQEIFFDFLICELRLVKGKYWQKWKFIFASWTHFYGFFFFLIYKCFKF